MSEATVTRKQRALKGHPAEDLARLCFSKLRFLSVSLKDKLRQEGLWEDLAQELYRIALEVWRQGLTAREMGGIATRELRSFMRAYGYRRYRGGFVKEEILLSLCDGKQALAKVGPTPRRDGLEEEILTLLTKHPEGQSQCQINRALKRLAPAAMVSDLCARLVVRGVVREVARPKGNGRPPSPMLVAIEYEPLLQEMVREKAEAAARAPKQMGLPI